VALAALPATHLATPPTRLVLTAPVPYEVSFGRVAGTAPAGTRWIVVRAGSRALPARRLRGRSFDFRVGLPLRETSVRVTAVRADDTRASATVKHVFGLPAAAGPRSARRGYADGALARRIPTLARRFPGTAGVYVEDLARGAGAAWNARARFPAASTLKLAIAVEVLRTLAGKPARGSPADSLLRSMLERSDNEAANRLEASIGGTERGGSARVDALLRSLGLVDSEMYGGYLRETAGRRPIPVQANARPWFGAGKYTTARDLARLLTLVHLASGGKGLLADRYGGLFTAADARYLLYLLAHSTDHGKLDRFTPAGTVVLHKAGWISSSRHDAGLVYWSGGVFVASVMTYGAGVGVASDVLAGRVARAALAVLSAPGARRRR
jgi:beta-lactamase class A